MKQELLLIWQIFRMGLMVSVLKIYNNDNKPVIWRKLLFEFLYTKNQAGEPWSPQQVHPMNHIIIMVNILMAGLIMDTGLGNPFITTRTRCQRRATFIPESILLIIVY